MRPVRVDVARRAAARRMARGGRRVARGGRPVEVSSVRARELRGWLVGELVLAVSEMLRWSPDLFRPGRDGSGKRLVPEATLSAILGLALKPCEGTVEREALQGDGRRDLKVTVGGLVMVVEVKKWGNNDYKRIQEQLEGAWDARVIGAVAVMLHDGRAATLADRYRAVCLSGLEGVVTELPAAAPLVRHFRVESMTPNGFRAVCEHLLVRIPRR